MIYGANIQIICDISKSRKKKRDLHLFVLRKITNFAEYYGYNKNNNHMKRRYLILLLMAVAVIGAKAQNTLNVYQKDGTLLCFSFADKPITLFVDDDVVVKCVRFARSPRIYNLPPNWQEAII